VVGAQVSLEPQRLPGAAISQERTMKKHIEPISSVQSELSVGDLGAITGGAPASGGRYGGYVPGGRQEAPQPHYGHERSERPSPPVDGPNRPYQPSGDGVLPPGGPGGGRNADTYVSMYGH
jgi:hypothetical protein